MRFAIIFISTVCKDILTLLFIQLNFVIAYSRAKTMNHPLSVRNLKYYFKKRCSMGINQIKILIIMPTHILLTISSVILKYLHKNVLKSKYFHIYLVEYKLTCIRVQGILGPHKITLPFALLSQTSLLSCLISQAKRCFQALQRERGNEVVFQSDSNKNVILNCSFCNGRSCLRKTYFSLLVKHVYNVYKQLKICHTTGNIKVATKLKITIFQTI